MSSNVEQQKFQSLPRLSLRKRSNTISKEEVLNYDMKEAEKRHRVANFLHGFIDNSITDTITDVEQIQKINDLKAKAATWMIR